MVVALVIMALASWQPLKKPGEVDPGHLGVLVPPVLFSVAALVLLVYAGLAHVSPVAVALAGAAVLAAAMARTALTVREIRGFHEARRQAATDELTGLPNRREFSNQLRSHLARASARARPEPLALLIIDIDRFKELNDALGHHAGDAVLAQLGPRLRDVLRTDDVLARLGGDEFAVLLPGARSAEEVGARIARVLEDRFPVEGIDVQIGASIGIAVFPQHGQDASVLLRTPTWPCTRPRPRGAATPSTPRSRTATRAKAGSPSASCATPSPSGSSSSTTSRSSTSRPARSPRWRRSCAGSTPSAGWCRRVSSCRWPSRPG